LKLRDEAVMTLATGNEKRVLLAIGGGVAAYKTLELARMLRRNGVDVRAVPTAAAQQFVTPLSLAGLTGNRVYCDLFSLTDEAEMGHIELSRSADLVVVAPATADLIGKMACGLADDLVSTLLLATDKKILLAPAMNLRMWLHPATQRNVAALRADGVEFIGPDEGEMACGEFGPGRMAEPAAICDAICALLAGDTRIALPGPAGLAQGRWPQGGQGLLAGRRVVVTSGPTHEPIDPVRYIANRSSGRQGHAIAAAAAAAGADVTLVSGPVSIPAPAGVRTVAVETALEMLDAVRAALPADIFVAVAAVADWRVREVSAHKVKKGASQAPALEFVENPDILRTVAQDPALRPSLVVGFAAETADLLASAKTKHREKSCDLVVANDVGAGSEAMGGQRNKVYLVSTSGVEEWPMLDKTEVAVRLVNEFARRLSGDRLSGDRLAGDMRAGDRS